MFFWTAPFEAWWLWWGFSPHELRANQAALDRQLTHATLLWQDTHHRLLHSVTSR